MPLFNILILKNKYALISNVYLNSIYKYQLYFHFVQHKFSQCVIKDPTKRFYGQRNFQVRKKELVVKKNCISVFYIYYLNKNIF